MFYSHHQKAADPYPLFDFLQLPSDPVHREPLQRPSAEEDGSVPDRDPGGQTRPVQHQSR